MYSSGKIVGVLCAVAPSARKAVDTATIKRESGCTGDGSEPPWAGEQLVGRRQRDAWSAVNRHLGVYRQCRGFA